MSWRRLISSYPEQICDRISFNVSPRSLKHCCQGRGQELVVPTFPESPIEGDVSCVCSWRGWAAESPDVGAAGGDGPGLALWQMIQDERK